jgi:hypothetical protein
MRMMNWARRLDRQPLDRNCREQPPVSLKTICIQAAVRDRELKRFRATKSSCSSKATILSDLERYSSSSDEVSDEGLRKVSI